MMTCINQHSTPRAEVPLGTTPSQHKVHYGYLYIKVASSMVASYIQLEVINKCHSPLTSTAHLERLFNHMKCNNELSEATKLIIQTIHMTVSDC